MHKYLPRKFQVSVELKWGKDQRLWLHCRIGKRQDRNVITTLDKPGTRTTGTLEESFCCFYSNMFGVTSRTTSKALDSEPRPGREKECRPTIITLTENTKHYPNLAIIRSLTISQNVLPTWSQNSLPWVTTYPISGLPQADVSDCRYSSNSLCFQQGPRKEG